MLDMISNFLTTVDDFVWGIPLIVLILATGLFLTARLRFLQITKLPHAIKHLIANEKSGEDGEVSSFAALCTALSATIGTGNIVGVATAIVDIRHLCKHQYYRGLCCILHKLFSLYLISIF